jgi:hypothetical protein
MGDQADRGAPKRSRPAWGPTDRRPHQFRRVRAAIQRRRVLEGEPQLEPRRFIHMDKFRGTTKLDVAVITAELIAAGLVAIAMLSIAT